MTCRRYMFMPVILRQTCCNFQSRCFNTHECCRGMPNARALQDTPVKAILNKLARRISDLMISMGQKFYIKRNDWHKLPGSASLQLEQWDDLEGICKPADEWSIKMHCTDRRSLQLLCYCSFALMLTIKTHSRLDSTWIRSQVEAVRRHASMHLQASGSSSGGSFGVVTHAMRSNEDSDLCRACASAAAAEVRGHRPALLDGPHALHLEDALPHYGCQHPAPCAHEHWFTSPEVHPHGLCPQSEPSTDVFERFESARSSFGPSDVPWSTVIRCLLLGSELIKPPGSSTHLRIAEHVLHLFAAKVGPC